MTACSGRERVALVTGASRGIGAGIARALGRAGARVAVAHRANRVLAEKVAADIAAEGGHAFAVALSVEDRASVRHAYRQIEDSLGEIDVLVNNAAIAQEIPFEALSDEDWDRMMLVNLRGPFACSQQALPGMARRGWGRIVNVSSIGGQWGGTRQVHYAAAKAGLINLTRSLAKLYGARGITANAVAPGLVRTDMTEQELSSQEGQEKVHAIPVGRIGTVDEVARVVAFLCTDGAAYVSGQTINVNGGMYFG